VLKVMREERLQENAKLVGAALKKGLEELKEEFPLIGDVRGCGLMLAVELVKDRATKEPAPEETLALFEETRHNGLISSRSGPYRNVIRMVPPLCLSMADADEVIGGFARSFRNLAVG
jgi:alanine-glyoxylate transaminase/(R)-3-amino-2-methylpropionate-pyruvate transaminase